MRQRIHRLILNYRYSKKNLSFESDKFLAISALATQLALFDEGAQYVAGLWKRDFLRELTWEADLNPNFLAEQQLAASSKTIEKSNRHRVRIAGLPTWSWASLSGAITYRNYSGTKAITSLSLQAISISLYTENEYGAIKSASVTVVGKTMEAYAVKVNGFTSPDHWSESKIPLTSLSYSQVDTVTPQPESNVLVGNPKSADTFRAVFYADTTDEVIAPDCILTCLLTCHIDRWPYPNDPDIAGIVLLPAANKDEYRRVGMFQTRGAHIRWFTEDKTLVLI